MTSFRPNRIIALAIFAFCWVATHAELAVACPTCKDGLHADGTALAYAVSILFMMAMPFIIFTFWVVTIIRLRAKAAELASAAAIEN